MSDYSVGDIIDRVSVREALQGCDAVVHSAALVATDPRQTNEMLTTNMQGAQNVLGQAVELGLDPIVHVSSFTALFHPNLETMTADLPVVGGADGYGTSKAQVDIYARGLQDAGAPVNITYPGMVLGPPVGNQYGEVGEGVKAALQMHVDSRARRRVADRRRPRSGRIARRAVGAGPRPAPLHRRRPPGSASRTRDDARQAADTTMVAVPIPDTALRVAGAVLDRAGRFLPFDTPFTSAGCSTTPKFRHPMIRRVSANSASPIGIRTKPWPTPSRPCVAPAAKAALAFSEAPDEAEHCRADERHGSQDGDQRAFGADQGPAAQPQ